MLSTLEDDMGVKYAWAASSGKLMVPRNWTEFQCVVTKQKEKRKVAKVMESAQAQKPYEINV